MDELPPRGAPQLATNLHTCPVTGRPYPEGVHRVTISGVTWTYCHVCRTGDGAPQPHPYLEKEHDHE